ESGTLLPICVQTVQCCATDLAGNVSCCSFIITVCDCGEAPKIACPVIPTQFTVQSICSAIVRFTPVVTDNCPNATFTCTPVSGSNFQLGTTQVSCTATDASG